MRLPGFVLENCTHQIRQRSAEGRASARRRNVRSGRRETRVEEEDTLDVYRPLSDTWNCDKTVKKLYTVCKVAEGLTDAPFAQVEPLRYHKTRTRGFVVLFFTKTKDN